MYTNFSVFTCLELARDALNAKGFHVVGGYMSPVNDAYKKKVFGFLHHYILLTLFLTLLMGKPTFGEF